jgi:hypothetical protein
LIGWARKAKIDENIVKVQQLVHTSKRMPIRQNGRRIGDDKEDVS